jgi:hypothetical protein
MIIGTLFLVEKTMWIYTFDKDWGIGGKIAVEKLITDRAFGTLENNKFWSIHLRA